MIDLVYVFGIEGVPIFEMLFVILCLMLVGLIFVLLELRKLNKIIKEEKRGVRRFEVDLAKFEQDKDESPSPELTAYIQNARAKGMTKEQIKKSLIWAGWAKQKIDRFLGF